VCEDEQKPAAPNRFIFDVLERSARRKGKAWRHCQAQRLDRNREIYEPVFIGRVVPFIDVGEGGVEC